MQAVTFRNYGSPEMLRLETLPDPVPRRGEILARVGAAEVTKSNCKLRAFRFSVSGYWVSADFAGCMRPRAGAAATVGFKVAGCRKSAVGSIELCVSCWRSVQYKAEVANPSARLWDLANCNLF